MKFSKDKQISKLISELLRQGWSYRNGKNHGKIISPAGRKFVVPGSPSDHRAFQNFKHDLQRTSTS